MSTRNPNVLNRINTLNTNLENANIPEIQRDISKRLFNILEWANSISVDSELYASINNITNTSDITNSIRTIRNELANQNAITINYPNWETPIDNTIIPNNNTPVEQYITDMNNAINWLANLSRQINDLRNRLTENHRILNDIHNKQEEQEDAGFGRRTIQEINDALAAQTRQKNTCNSLLDILSNIETLERSPEYNNDTHANHTEFVSRHNRAVASFNRNRNAIAWINQYNNNWDYSGISVQVQNALTNCDTAITRLNQESTLSQEINRLQNSLPRLERTVPNNLWLSFNTENTVITRENSSTAANTHTQMENINRRLTELDVLEWQIETLRTRYEHNRDRLNNIASLQRLQESTNRNHPWVMDRRHNEFASIRDILYNNLLLWENRDWDDGRERYEPDLPNTTVSIWCAETNINLNFMHWNFDTDHWHFEYTLCDSEHNPLRLNWGRFEYQLWTQTISIWWIRFNNNDLADQRMIIHNLQINPVEWITFPVNLDLNVRVRIHDPITGFDIDHHKPIRIEITRPTLEQRERNDAYETLMPPMNERIEAEYSNRYREDLENEAIWRILREWNEAEANEIYNNEARRNMFIDRIRNTLNEHFPLLPLNDLQTWFRAEMINENRDVPIQYLLSQNAFQNYLRQNIPENLRNYASWQINNRMDAYRNEIMQEFLTFQRDIVNNPRDNDNHLELLHIANNIPDDQPDNIRQRFWRRWSTKNNYTKFFQWRSANLENQTLETEDWEIKYWVKVEVLWVNKIVATINIDGKEEPEIIEAANHDRLIRWILRRAHTKDWEPLNRKLRCNLALSVLKAIVMMSPQRLSRQIPNTAFPDARWNEIECDRIDAFVRDWNLRIRGWRVDTATHTRQNVTIFDEASFKTLHNINTLETWIHQLSTQINTIMNATAQEYQNATDSLRDDRRLLRYNTKQRLRGGPIKRLWWRMLYGKTNNDFDFETSVNEAWKNVNISFNWWIFTVTWEFDGKEYAYQSRDLWWILRRKINRKRVFDGVELAMVAAINEQYVSRLRTNNLIQTENFAVSDLNENKTWRVYIFDETWNLSYLEIEERWLSPLRNGANAGRIDPNEIPIERIRCNDQERREFFQNPLLAWRLLRVMRRRLALF